MNQGGNCNADAAGQAPRQNDPWQLRLYVNGRTSLRTIVTLQNLTELCDKYLEGQYELEIVDLAEDPGQGQQDQVLALPTLVRRSPGPVRKIIGELSNTSQVIVALGLPGADPYAL
jgi:circadian clock protein KaiB